MKTLAFFDCPTGISGDMCLGALVSAGVPIAYLQTQIAQLQLPEIVELKATQVRKNGIAATQVEVMLPHEEGATTPQPPIRHLPEIQNLIQAAQLPDRAIAWSLAIFRRLAQAEGAIHGIEPQQVHFHEVGATDAIVDIVGTCLGLDWLGIDALHCAPLPTGRGTIRAAHGRLPVPAPAVLKLMEMAQVPIYNADLAGELVTPTGAAIATELATHFGDPPAMQLHKVGLGAGNKELPLPNILRLWVGQAVTNLEPSGAGTAGQAIALKAAHSDHTHPHPVHTDHVHPEHPHSEPAPPSASSRPTPTASLRPNARIQTAPNPALNFSLNSANALPGNPPSSVFPLAAEREAQSGRETVTVLETQVDDLSPQAIGYLYDRLFAAGALDVFVQAVTMKKSRPGHLLVAIADPAQADACETVLLTETTTLGVRRTDQTRLRLRREIVPLQLALGPVRMKVAFLPDGDRPLKAHPEYEDCAAIARQHQIPWQAIHQQALAAWHQHLNSPPHP